MNQTLDSYEAVRSYLYGLKHRGALYGIDRMREFVAHLGHPELAYPVIHVAGTNGKGSTCAMLESIFRTAGYKTGLFTSPHLVHQGERVQVDRHMLTREDIVAYTRRLKPIAEAVEQAHPDHHPTFFEFMTGMAFLRFAEAAVDVGIIETGLGGRLDATNVVQPELSVITSISLDHTDILGDTIEAIASEKAGIIKPGKPVVMGLLPVEAEQVIEQVARDRGAPLHKVSEAFGADEGQFPLTGLPGDYQRHNAATATLAARILGDSFKLSEAQIREGLLRVNWAGRWERHNLKDRAIILDATHNPEGALHLEKNLQQLVRKTGKKPVILAGTLGLPRARALMPVVARYAREIHLLVPKQPRACSLEELRASLPSTFEGKVFESAVHELFPAPGTCAAGNPAETLVATGSIYLIGEIMEALYHEVPVGEQSLQD
ncbi:bifunctional folylpolyglutamate synthase/dihydrofolate synthase [Puniceicoccales bacterium CK1056]|uniref:tetrahydrofolate synthase n=1 Tax=Oceanipulchritudo coccoides TaxID=2706888 RepID=A0A6B2M0T3_9BACT|nr:folylpolyglutamate synthase/dihydrofolate synthase family protein [Oceanipulchritudo coccoides]NDV61714.1 bifunctional folylpolyglutamate synthase/dihydrofolate synthase [Oceanipulchritudo coccoides]